MATELHPASIMEAIADSQPDELALWSGSVRRTWAELDERAARFAALLDAAGVPRLAGVGLMMRNCNEYLEAHHGVYKGRRIPINVNYRYRDSELVYLLADCEAKALIFDADLAPLIASMRTQLTDLHLLVCVDDGTESVEANKFVDYEQALGDHDPAPRQFRSPDDPYLFYTGGTTGMPKGMEMNVGARLSEAAVKISTATLCLPEDITAYGADAAAALRERDEALISLPAAPLMHSTAMNASAMPTLLFGGTVVTCRSRSFDPVQILDIVGETKANTLTIGGDALGKPLLLELEARASSGRPGNDLDSLRVIVSAGMAWSQDGKRGFLELLPEVNLIDLYGSTEGLAGILHLTSRDRLDSTPTFEPTEGTRLLAEDGTEVPVGEPGLVAFPVPDTERYHGDEKKTEEVFRSIDGVRYSIPGDWAAMESNGMMRPIGRGAKVINTGGEKVFTEEVEAVIRELGGVIDCLVIGGPSERWGEEVLALVAAVPGQGPTADEVRAGVRFELADYKVPKRVAIVDAIPRHANSKADFDAAAALLGAGLSGSRS